MKKVSSFLKKSGRSFNNYYDKMLWDIANEGAKLIKAGSKDFEVKLANANSAGLFSFTTTDKKGKNQLSCWTKIKFLENQISVKAEIVHTPASQNTNDILKNIKAISFNGDRGVLLERTYSFAYTLENVVADIVYDLNEVYSKIEEDTV